VAVHSDAKVEAANVERQVMESVVAWDAGRMKQGR
jgi:hypothetical protein